MRTPVRWATTIWLGALLTLGMGGCLATRDYVDEHDNEIRTALTARIDALDRDLKAAQGALGARVDTAETHITEVRAGAAQAQNRADLAQARADQLGAAVESARANRFRREKVSEVAVVFEQGKAALSRRAQTALDGVAATLDKNPTYTLDVLGYTDKTGDDRDNVTLTWQRAETVRRRLIERGVDMSRIYFTAMGEDSARGKKTGRHVAVRILKPAD